MHAYVIAEDRLESADVLDLLRLHLAEMHAASPACKVHAFSPERLRGEDVTFYTVRTAERLAAVGALKQIDATRGELKSMRAAPDFRGKGAGAALLAHMIAEARARGLQWLGLETGRTPEFDDAHALYRRYGFAECGAFGDYVPDEFSLCMEMKL